MTFEVSAYGGEVVVTSHFTTVGLARDDAMHTSFAIDKQFSSFIQLSRKFVMHVCPDRIRRLKTIC